MAAGPRYGRSSVCHYAALLRHRARTICSFPALKTRLRGIVMRPNNAKFIQSALLLSSVLLGACGGGGTTTTTSASVPVAVFSSMGADFYLTLPDHLCASSPALCNNAPITNKLIVAAATATTGEVTFNGVVTPFTVAAGSQGKNSLNPAAGLPSKETIE